jgi:hypothetical protein
LYSRFEEVSEIMHFYNKNRNNVKVIAAAATFFTLAIIFASTTSPVAAATTTISNATTTTTTSPSSGLEFSPQPIWDEQVRTTSIIPINETHNMAEFEGNGTMTVPDTGETINMTNNGTAIGSLVPTSNNTVSSYGREYVFSEDDDDTTAITFYELVRYDPATFEGKGLVLAVFDNNATGSLAPFNGMIVVGTHEENPETQAVIIRLWEWQGGIPLPSISQEPPLMNTTTTTNATADTNATAATIPPEEEVVEEQQQQATPTAPAPQLE